MTVLGTSLSRSRSAFLGAVRPLRPPRAAVDNPMLDLHSYYLYVSYILSARSEKSKAEFFGNPGFLETSGTQNPVGLSGTNLSPAANSRPQDLSRLPIAWEDRLESPGEVLGLRGIANLAIALHQVAKCARVVR